MARESNAMVVAKLKQITAQQCPVTSGAPIKMSRSGFERACAIRQEESTAPRCHQCKGRQLPAELTIIDIDRYKVKNTEEKIMSETNYTLGDLNNKLFAQLDRLTNDSLKGDALTDEINRAKAVTEIAGTIINSGSLALKAKVAFKERNAGANIPKMLEG
jgi:hypothetical protein